MYTHIMVYVFACIRMFVNTCIVTAKTKESHVSRSCGLQKPEGNPALSSTAVAFPAFYCDDRDSRERACCWKPLTMAAVTLLPSL